MVQSNQEALGNFSAETADSVAANLAIWNAMHTQNTIMVRYMHLS